MTIYISQLQVHNFFNKDLIIPCAKSLKMVPLFAFELI